MKIERIKGGSEMENTKRIINQIINDEEFFNGGIGETERELKAAGFTERQAGEIVFRLRKVAEKIAAKAE